MPDAEVPLWSELKPYRKMGAHFRRQVAIGNYVVDFACHRNRLIVEIDGLSHTTDDAIAKDAERQRELERCGYSVLRFTNEDVFTDCGSVIETILAFTHQERPEATRRRSSPLEGEVAREAGRRGGTMPQGSTP